MALDPAERKGIIEHLGEQLARGEVGLFTGAGFSHGVLDTSGRTVPQVDDLRREIAELMWPDEPFDEHSGLGDTFGAALREGRNRLAEHLRSRLTVDPESLTSHHELWLSMPWRRAYTVNIDDLEAAAARRWQLPRTVRPHSALTGGLPLGGGSELLFVHLNGTLDDIPDVTFSEPQYGWRQARSNPLYEQLAAELLAYPIVFVGSTLRESLFWQYVTLRDDRGARGVSEMRPRSYLVTPSLPADRRRLLGTYNVQWVPLTTAEFADEVLAAVKEPARTGLQALRSAEPRRGTALDPPKVVELSSLPQPQASEYLLGARPRWDDIRLGRAVERTFETALDLPRRGRMIVTGTAGAGTSTTMMRLALRLVAAGRDVRWIDASQEIGRHDLGRWLRKDHGDLAVFCDDADTFGRGLMDLVADAAASPGDTLLVLGLRAARVDRVLSGWKADGQENQEVNVPLLGDEDIEALLASLEEDNKLGTLKPLSHEARVERIRQECGRELIVAMHDATSDVRFEVKVAEEFGELEHEQRLLYAIAAIATDLRTKLLRDELLLACGDPSNTALYAIDRLAARRLLLQEQTYYSVRHRRVAELIVTRLRRSAEMLAPYRGLLRAMAVKYQGKGGRSREARLFTALLSHRRIGHGFALEDARSIYEDLEEICKEDYHYWLQRGSFEVSFGSLSLARTWLSHAKDGGSHDHRVQTEWAYYLLKSARKDPAASDASERVADGQAILLDYIDGYGDTDIYPWHVYGSQMLGWSRAAPLSKDEKAELLREVVGNLRRGVQQHPGSELDGLLHDLERELLMLAVPE